MHISIFFAAALAFANGPVTGPGCELPLSKAPLFGHAEPPEKAVERFAAAAGGFDPLILTGPHGIRARLDRAFARFLITKFRAFADDAPPEVTMVFNHAEHLVLRELHQILNILSPRHRAGVRLAAPPVPNPPDADRSAGGRGRGRGRVARA